MPMSDWPYIGWGAGWAAFMTLAFLILRAVVKGDWIPRSTHDRELDRAQHDANEWRTEGRIKDEVIHTDLETIKTGVVESGQTLHNFLEALQKAGALKRGGD